MTADRPQPALASVTIRHLILPDGSAGQGLGEAVAAALALELGAESADAPQRPGVAQAIARGIASHPDLAGRSKDGRR